jgi:hypothetical protein
MKILKKMKEEFRIWVFRQQLKVQYTAGNGAKAFWEKNQEELLSQIIQIVESYLEQDIKLTSRQLYYQLVSANIIPNAEETYKRICKFLTDARYAGLIDWESIEDRGRTPEKHSEWATVSDLVQSAIYSYRLPRWKDQDYYVELYCEKQAMESVLKPIADKYHIYFGSNKGYLSASTMYDLAKRIQEKIEEERKAIILYLGDHDPSGLDMVRDIKKRIEEFLTEGDDYTEPNLEVIQLALNKEQIKRYNPPPNPAKITDPRAKWYFAEYGTKSWELDALKPEVLIEITERGILQFVDLKKYKGWIELESEQKKALEKFGKSLDRK